MKKILNIILLFFVFGCINGFAQSDMLLELKQQIAQGNSEFILQVVSEPDKADHPDVRQYLKSLASDKERRILNGSAAYFAHIALAKLGEREFIEQIISEVEADSPVHVVGMKKLFLVGGKIAFKKFYDLLDDSSQIKINENCEDKSAFCGDVFFYPKNFTAILYLSQMVDNPPTRRGVPSNKVLLWKDWFENHKELLH